MMRRRKHLPGNVDDLARPLEQIWQKMPYETIRVLYHSMPRNVAVCTPVRYRLTPYLARYFVNPENRIATLRLHYLNILESSKFEVTVAGLIAFLIISAYNARLKYPIYFAYPIHLFGVDWKYTRIYNPQKDA
ncbi:hypothetical protein TNCV_2631071 [Trichonephila clavipes]|nr:hypothetical protein TNCV_2631071 [Trichonephila clavipes]